MFSFHPRFHFHRYGVWKDKYPIDNREISSFWYRSCKICNRVKERYVS